MKNYKFLLNKNSIIDKTFNVIENVHEMFNNSLEMSMKKNKNSKTLEKKTFPAENLHISH